MSRVDRHRTNKKKCVLKWKRTSVNGTNVGTNGGLFLEFVTLYITVWIISLNYSILSIVTIHLEAASLFQLIFNWNYLTIALFFLNIVTLFMWPYNSQCDLICQNNIYIVQYDLTSRLYVSQLKFYLSYFLIFLLWGKMGASIWQATRTKLWLYQMKTEKWERENSFCIKWIYATNLSCPFTF